MAGKQSDFARHDAELRASGAAGSVGIGNRWRLEALQQMEDAGRTWRIGAGVTHARLEDARGRLFGSEMLCEVAAAIAYRSVRNRGTIGGSLAHADPAADWPLALAALGASLNIRGPTPRNLPVAHFIQGAFTTTLAANEVIESIDVPKLSRAGRYGFYKFCRKTGEFAEAIVRWVREDVAPTVRSLDAALRSIDNYASYDCRGRNRVVGAR